MKRIQCILWMGLLGIAASCNKNGEEPLKFPRLIYSYLEPQAIYCVIGLTDLVGENPPIIVTPDPPYTIRQIGVYIRYYDQTAGDYGVGSEGLIAEYNLPERYLELAARFNDHDYNGYDNIHGVLFRPTAGLHIVSDTDYDALHPAGTPLDDLFTIVYHCYDDFIRNRYRGGALNDVQRQYGKPSTWNSEQLSVFNTRQLTLVPLNCWLHLDAAPVQTSTHRFTVTYENVDGLSLSTTTDPIPILGAQ